MRASTTGMTSRNAQGQVADQPLVVGGRKVVDQVPAQPQVSDRVDQYQYQQPPVDQQLDQPQPQVTKNAEARQQEETPPPPGLFSVV